MHLLVIKTSSLGDVLHTLPAISDAAKTRNDLKIDWLVEENYADVPSWHPAVNRIIPVAMRRWRNLFSSSIPGEMVGFIQQLRQQTYDHIIDAQGLMKSALLGLAAKGPVSGLDRQSVREPAASATYRSKYTVSRQQAAVQRIRHLFSQALGYTLPDTAADYGIDHTRLPRLPSDSPQKPGVVLLHGTTWPSKLWPVPCWHELAKLLTAAGYPVYCVWGNPAERQISTTITQNIPNTSLMPALSLGQLARVLTTSTAAVAVDTGPGHLAAAAGTPCVSLYLSTDPQRTGTVGPGQRHLTASYACAPCLRRQCDKRSSLEGPQPCCASLSPATVFAELQQLIRLQPPTALS